MKDIMLLGDNMSVMVNTVIPLSQLKKKHNAIAYHRVRGAIAAKIIRFAHIPSTENRADCLTKPLTNDMFLSLVQPVLFRLSNSHYRAWFMMVSWPKLWRKICLFCEQECHVGRVLESVYPCYIKEFGA